MRATCEPLDTMAGLDPATSTTRFLSTRRSLWGWGEALRVTLPAPWPEHVHLVAQALEGIEVRGDLTGPARGPLAFAALPFRPDTAAAFVVPALTIGWTPEGDRWVTRIGDGPRIDPEATPLAVDPQPQRIEVVDEQTAEAWCETVAKATSRIVAGDLTKVVLARHLRVHADVPFDVRSIADLLERAHPHALRSLVDGVVGASPELLVSRMDHVVRAQPMAGTIPRSGDPAVDQRAATELLASAKNRVEHQITIDALLDALIGWCSYLDSEPEPHVVEAGPVQHLATMVEGRLSLPAPSVLELVAAVHPTPAVGGWPRDRALALIDELEPAARGTYAGPVGWVDAYGNGAFAVGIRSVSVHGTDADLWAGVGVVADSDPLAELEETRAKFAATLGSVVRL